MPSYTVGAFGWEHMPERSKAYAASLAPSAAIWERLRATDDNGDRFWYRALALSFRLAQNTRWIREGRVVSLNQLQVGSCVGHGEAKRASYLAAVEAWHLGQPEKVVNMVCPEFSYWASRVECGMIGRGDGSTGEGAAAAAVKTGILWKGKYGSVDCNEYTEARCRQWGDGKGIPDEAKAEAKPHVCGQKVLVNTAEKVWLAIGAGSIINFCSMQGFEGKRDADGAIKPSGTWPHSMCGGAARYTTKSGRKLVLIDQSWGDNWTSGDYYGDQPWGSFYADLDVVGDMASEGDTFADIAFAGEPLPEAPVDWTRI